MSFGVLTPSTAKYGALMFKHDNAEGFVVILGLRGAIPWCDIVTDVEKADVDYVYTFYDINVKLDVTDRATKPLLAGKSVSVGIRKQVVSGNKVYGVHISVYDNS